MNITPREYFINRNRQKTGEHEIHVKECKTFPEPQNAIPLGVYNICSAAKEAAKRAYPNWEVDGCKNCLRECHTR
ncbi:MAG: hypothetical protein HAW61_02540 [Candidatus Portiera sp.]|nr:hypothetical protein [Portiera sp.]